eukprot:7243864-Lingulodinium_polyedra.AAC.1
MASVAGSTTRSTRVGKDRPSRPRTAANLGALPRAIATTRTSAASNLGCPATASASNVNNGPLLSG